MNCSLNASVLIVALLLSTASVAGDPAHSDRSEATSTSTAQDTVDVQHVMDAFHQAVLAHGGARLAALFVPEGSAWITVLSDGAYAHAKAKSPDTAKIRSGSYQDFAKFVSSSKARLDPEHSHVKIQSDGTIASVYFDFVFLIDGKAENRGSETWQPVKGAAGWRIAAITYSSDPQKS
jgi:hypothetical protein